MKIKKAKSQIVSNPNGVNLHPALASMLPLQDERFKPQRGKFTLIASSSSAAICRSFKPQRGKFTPHAAKERILD